MYKVVEHSNWGYGDKVVKRFRKLDRAVDFARKLNSNTWKGSRNERYEVHDDKGPVWDDIEGWHDNYKTFYNEELFKAIYGSDTTI